MTEFEQVMKEIARDAKKTIQIDMADLNKRAKSNRVEYKEDVEESVGAVLGLLGGLFSDMLGGLEVEKETEKQKPTPKADSENHEGKEPASLYKTFLTKKSLGAKFKLTDLNKEVLENLLHKENITVEQVANLFDVTIEIVEYAMSLTGVEKPKEKDLLEKTLLHTYGLSEKELNDYFKERIESMLKVKEKKLKSIIVKDFILSLCDIGYELKLTQSRNQLMLIKLDNYGKVVVSVYNLPVELFLAKYDLNNIKWN